MTDQHVIAEQRNEPGGYGLFDRCMRTRGLGFIPSAGNFLAIDFSRPAEGIFQAMMQQGVIVRPIANYGMPDFLRVTIGSDDENGRFIEVLDRVLHADV